MTHFLDGDDWDTIVKDLVQPIRRLEVDRAEAIDAFYGTAVQTIGRGQPVRLLSGGLALASSDLGQVCGIALNDAPLGSRCDYVTRGSVLLEGWHNAVGTPRLTSGAYYFLNGVGSFSYTPPQTGYLISLGYAHSPLILDLNIGIKIKL